METKRQEKERRECRKADRGKEAEALEERLTAIERKFTEMTGMFNKVLGALHAAMPETMSNVRSILKVGNFRDA